MRAVSRFIIRSIYRIYLEIGWRPSLSEAVRLWRLADILYIGLFGPRGVLYPEYEVFRRLCDLEDVSDVEVLKLLQSPSVVVVGYAFEILIYRDSDLVEKSLEIVKERRDEVVLGVGCMTTTVPLGEFVADRIYQYKHVQT